MRRPMGIRSDVRVVDLSEKPLKLKDGTIVLERGWRARGRVRDRSNHYREVVVIRDNKGEAKREAERRLEFLGGMIKAGVVDERPSTVAELADRWLEMRSRSAARATATPPARPGHKVRQELALSPNSLASYASVVRGVIIPELGDMRLDDLTVTMLDDALIALDDVRSTRIPRTVLGQMFAHAVARGWIGSNPMRNVSPERRVRTEVQALTVGQARALLALANAQLTSTPTTDDGKGVGGRRTNRDLRDCLYLLLGTGIRIGELIALRWSELDLSADVPVVEIAATMIEPRGKEIPSRYRQPYTKSRESRTIPLPEAVRALLVDRKETRGVATNDEFVFAGETGEPIWPSNIRTRLRNLTADVEGLQGSTPHTMRRTVGDRLFDLHGLQAVVDVLGHTPGGVSFQHYVRSRRVDPSLRTALDTFFEEDNSGTDEPLRGEHDTPEHLRDA